MFDKNFGTFDGGFDEIVLNLPVGTYYYSEQAGVYFSDHMWERYFEYPNVVDYLLEIGTDKDPKDLSQEEYDIALEDAFLAMDDIEEIKVIPIIATWFIEYGDEYDISVVAVIDEITWEVIGFADLGFPVKFTSSGKYDAALEYVQGKGMKRAEEIAREPGRENILYVYAVDFMSDRNETPEIYGEPSLLDFEVIR